MRVVSRIYYRAEKLEKLEYFLPNRRVGFVYTRDLHCFMSVCKVMDDARSFSSVIALRSFKISGRLGSSSELQSSEFALELVQLADDLSVKRFL